jgi:hypothetical protein
LAWLNSWRRREREIFYAGRQAIDRPARSFAGIEIMTRLNSSRQLFGVAGAIAFTALVFSAAPAVANGGDFFEELALHGLQANPDMGSPYFGFVRDQRGRGVNDALLVAKVNATGETNSVETNILGHYTLDGFDNSISSEDVDIHCEKDGFTQIQIERRVMADRTLQPVEVNCVLAPITADAS